jgi:hypothetical protein
MLVEIWRNYNLYTDSWNIKWYSQFEKIKVPEKLRIELPYESAILLLSCFYPKKKNESMI